MAPPHSGYSSTEIWIELEFGNVGFRGEGKTGVPGEKPLGAEKRTNNKLNPLDPEPHRREASALTTASSLRHPCSHNRTLAGLPNVEKQINTHAEI